MASTYTLNNGIELIGTGEQSGTWGDTTNTNLSLVDTALDGQVTVTLASAGTSGSPNTLPISDGAASDGRNRMVIFNDGGDLGATAYVQLTPNDAEKIIYVRNDLAGSRSIILFQGTYNASNDYELPAGTTAVIYFDGAGSGAVAANVFNNAYFDSLRLGSVSVTEIIDDDTMATASATNIATSESIKAYVDTQVGANNELSEVLANGNTTGGTDISVSSGDDITFADNSKTIFGASSDLQIYHGGNHSFISEQGTGNLKILADSLVMKNAADTQNYITGTSGGAAALYYAGSEKLATESGGVNITGTLTSDELTVDNAGSSSLVSIQAGVPGSVSGDPKLEFIGATSASGVAGYANISLDVPSGGKSDMYFQTAASGGSGGQANRMKIDGNGDITFYDTSGNASFVYDESAGSTFNENGDNKDFRVESSNVTNMLFVDAANDRVGVATSPEARLHIRHGTYGDVNGGIQMEGGNQHHYWTLESATHSKFSIGSTAGQFSWVQSAGEMFRANGSGVIINESAVASFDFRVEGSSDPNLIKADAGNNSVGVGVSPSADAKFHIDGGSSPTEYFRAGTNNRRHLKISSYDTGSLDAGHNINASSVSGQLTLSASGVEHMRIDAQSSYTAFNETSQAMDFRVETNSTSHMLFVDSTTNSTSIGGNAPSSSYLLNVVNSQRITGATAELLLNATNSGSGNHVATIDVRTLAERGSHIALIDDDGVEYGIKRDYSGGSPITRAILYADDGTTQRRILDWGKAGNYAVFNEEGNDMDFRVETAANANAIFVDASADSVGVLTNNVTGYDFIAAGNATRLGSHLWTTRSYSVPTATYVDIYWNNATQVLDNTYIYRWQLTTTGTGTDTGAIYHATYANGSWTLYVESRGSTSSNSPQLRIDASTGKAQVFHNHPSSYTINVLGEAKYVGNNNNLGTQVGLASYFSYQWTQNGMIGNQYGSSSIDFRIGSGTNTHALFVDASADRIGVKTNNPTYDLDVNGTAQFRGTVASGVAKNVVYQGSTGQERAKVYLVQDVLNASESTRFTFTGGNRRSCVIEITASGSWTASNTASNHPAAKYIMRAFTNSSGVTVLDGPTAIYQYGYSLGNFTFTNQGSFGYTIDLENPTGDNAVSFTYKIELLSADGDQNLTASSTV